MNLIFLGAAHEVTGSCTLLTACGKNILIDCGMEQGPDTYKNRDIPVSPADIDCIFLTHAHRPFRQAAVPYGKRIQRADLRNRVHSEALQNYA